MLLSIPTSRMYIIIGNSIDLTGPIPMLIRRGKCWGISCDLEPIILRLCGNPVIGLYSTPGMDGCKIEANGYNQVTPRFLEYISCGCHVLARYPDNEDTDWYDLQTMAKRINSYEEFEIAVDEARKNPVDMKLYSDYLAKHYTSVRARELEALLKELV